MFITSVMQKTLMANISVQFKRNALLTVGHKAEQCGNEGKYYSLFYSIAKAPIFYTKYIEI
ncbi:hypothetical protein HMPREF0023_2363 [Acinetobacter sp. ATCC 27244]|nr:hypothetical protein HMPREF0023_2363 [Acinetobacter sp. ATCC 27244]